MTPPRMIILAACCVAALPSSSAAGTAASAASAASAPLAFVHPSSASSSPKSTIDLASLHRRRSCSRDRHSPPSGRPRGIGMGVIPIPPRRRLGLSSELRMAKSQGGGDQLRSSTGIRPSLHPTTINAISDALLLRSSSDVPTNTIDAYQPGVEPLAVAVTAGRIATDALEKRAASCQADDDLNSVPTPEECQTVAGRVVGVVMRLRELEAALVGRVGGVGWVSKYGEHGSFGVLESECAAAAAAAADAAAKEAGDADDAKLEVNAERESELSERVRDDPLFRMCRAECVLAIYLRTVEAPKLVEIGEQVPGGSEVDFIDEDRIGVLLS